jgi:hypothetical protein
MSRNSMRTRPTLPDPTAEDFVRALRPLAQRVHDRDPEKTFAYIAAEEAREKQAFQTTHTTETTDAKSA